MSAVMQRNPIRARALDWLSERPLYLDTETTGLDNQAEVIEVAILDHTGKPLLDTLVKPTRPIPRAATDVHGITNEDVAQAPTFPAIYERVAFLMTVRRTVIYNAEYDLRLLRQSARQWGVRPIHLEAHCAMLLYAEHYGEWDDRRNSFRWQRLMNAARQCGLDIPMNLHRASADAELTRQLVHYMAGG